MQMMRVTFVIISFAIFQSGLCFQSGAPETRCENMMPEHAGSLPQARASPYEVRIKKSYYMPGESVKVSIESASDDMIKGYLIQAREVGANTAIGTFATLPTNGRYVNCGNSKVRPMFMNFIMQLLWVGKKLKNLTNERNRFGEIGQH